MKFILMGLLKRFRREYGREPNFSELTNMGKMAKEIENAEKVIPFPTDRIKNPLEPRPTKPEGTIPVTVKGKTSKMSPEGIMDMLMGKGKAKDVNLGKAPKTTKTKEPVDQKLIMTGNVDNLSADEIKEKLRKILEYNKELINITPDEVELDKIELPAK